VRTPLASDAQQRTKAAHLRMRTPQAVVYRIRFF
jgi:hypothetical protein